MKGLRKMPRAKTCKNLVQCADDKKVERSIWRTGYKGFEKDMTCRGKQYQIHSTFEESEVALCAKGMHFCTYPLGTLRFYPPVRQNRYAEVAALSPCQTDEFRISDNYGKVVTAKLRVRREISIRELCEAAEYMIMTQAVERNPRKFDLLLRTCRCKYDKVYFTVDCERQSSVYTGNDRACAINSGACSLATTFGDYAVANCTNGYSRAYSGGRRSSAVTTGAFSVARSSDYNSVAASTGKVSVSVNPGGAGVSVTTGDCSIALSDGDCSIAGSTGNVSAAINDGDKSVAATTVNTSDATNNGRCAIAATTGRGSDAYVTGKQACALTTGVFAHASAVGEQSTAIALGPNGLVKGAHGCFLACMEWELDNHDKMLRPVRLVTAVVDGEKIKPDTWYTARNGELVESISEEER